MNNIFAFLIDMQSFWSSHSGELLKNVDFLNLNGKRKVKCKLFNLEGNLVGINEIHEIATYAHLHLPLIIFASITFITSL